MSDFQEQLPDSAAAEATAPIPPAESPFMDIVRGLAPGVVIARDDTLGFAIIKSLEQEAAVHWLAFPYEIFANLDEMRAVAPDRFLQLFEFVQREVERLRPHYDHLEHGYTIKIHCGAYETIAQAKLHILSKE